MICNVNIYIDENSICQAMTKSDFIVLVHCFLKFSAAFKVDISGVEIKYVLWKRLDLESRELSVDNKKITFLTAVNSLLETDIKLLLKKVLYDKSCQVWNEEQVHSDDIYYEMSNGECITGDTLAECAELTLTSNKYPIAFVNSKVIQGGHTTIIKGWEGEARDYINVELADLNIDSNAWLRDKYRVADFCYDFRINMPPTDQQTYLRDTNRYSKTKYINQGRSVYFFSLDRTYHVVDNLHHGENSHIEVWNRFGIHLGENNLDGLQLNKGDNKKNHPEWLN